MRVLLTGASGFIGRLLAAALAQAGHQVVPVSRRHGIDMAGLCSPADWRGLLEGVDAVVNAVGVIGQVWGKRAQSFETLHTRAPLALFQACVDADVRRVVQISALGADDTAFSAYHLSKRAADEGLRRLPLEWVVLRPGLVYGPGGASTVLFGRLAALPWIPVIGDGRQQIQPVHVGDVVDAVLRALSTPTTGQTLDLVGPQTLSFADWLQRLRQAQGLPPTRLLHVPYPLALGLCALGQGLSPLLRPDNLRMLQAAPTADTGPLERFLDRPPAAATPDLLSTVFRSHA